MTPAQRVLFESITRALMAVLGAWNRYLQEEKDKEQEKK